MTDLHVVTLVSVGAHPTSGRPRRAEQDARAVELGLRLSGERLQVVHAGDASDETLRAYLGMGLPGLTVLQQPPRADALPALVEHLANSPAQLVLTGSQAETGEGSGMLPYLLAERLGWPLVVGLADIESVENGQALVLQALPRGQRRRLRVRLPFLASVDNGAPAARQSAFGPARRGQLQVQEAAPADDPLLAVATLQPARPRPKRLKVVSAGNAAERMRAATRKATGGGGQTLEGVSPQAAAEAIFNVLLDEGVLR